MTTTELGACEWFVWDLRRSNLIDRGQLDQLVSEFLRKEVRAEPPALAQFLIDQGILSTFQAEGLLQGKSQGLVLGPYVLMDALGSGSMGTVYLAHSKNDGKEYAVKVLPRRSMWNVRIARRLVRSFEQCRHPAVVPFVDVGTAGGTHYLVWPMIEGETLEAIVQQQGKLSPGLSAYFGLKIAEGLAACHSQQLVHGLLKPSNLMVGPDQQIHILDCGIGTLLANSEGESLVDTMSTANTLTSGLDCASPECILEPAERTPAGDQYSLGCVLYFCLTGRYPFMEETAVEKMMAHQTKRATPVRELNPDASPELEAVVERLMEKTPEARFPSTAAVIEALQPLAAAPGGGGRMLGWPGKSRTQRDAKSDPFAALAASSAGANLHDTPVPRSERGTPPLPGRGSPAQPAPVAAPAVAAMPRFAPAPRALSFTQKGGSLDEKLGPVGLIVGAILATCLTWVLSLWMFR